MNHNLTEGLGPHVCAVCLCGIDDGALVATKSRFSWEGTFDDGRVVKAAEDHAHAECECGALVRKGLDGVWYHVGPCGVVLDEIAPGGLQGARR